jgi:putative hemolysin
VPRVDVSLVSAEAGDDGVHEELEKAAGRFVVLHGETPDEVLGVVDTRLWRVGGKRPWREVMKAAVFVPETMPLLDALEVHLHDDESVVLVVDEYGGFEGLVSQEEIADWLLHEAAPWLGEDAEIREIEKGRYFLDGAARLDHLAEATGVVLPLQGLEGIDTVGGLVFHELGRVPKAGERLRIGNVEIKVRRMARARVKQLEVRLTETALVTAEGVRV